MLPDYVTWYVDTELRLVGIVYGDFVPLLIAGC